MQVFYIIIGSVLALVGGIIGQLFQNHLTIKRNDKKTLSDVLSILLSLEKGESPSESDIHFESLKSLASNIRAICYRSLAIEIIKFSNKADTYILHRKRIEKDLKSLMSKTAKIVGKPLFIYQKKEDEYFKKLGKAELAKIEKEKKREKH